MTVYTIYIVTKYPSVLRGPLFYFTVIELTDFPHVVTPEDTEEKICICIKGMYREFVPFTRGTVGVNNVFEYKYIR